LDQTELLKQLPDAPQWALFAGTAGRLLVYAGLGLFLASIVLWILQPKKPSLAKFASISFIGGAFSILGAMACLVALFVGNQFEYRYIFSHGDTATAIYYKIAGVWTAQEGSFLLWACTSAIFGLLAFRGTGIYRRWYCVVFSVFLACLCGILAYETPFDLIKEFALNGVAKVPHAGSGMTPSLQNYWVVIHPPTIFMGFGSLTVMFAMSVSAMLTGNAKEWIKITRPWTLVSASVLGLGLCMGGMWAYETQGWGGFWAWDPVENVSFVPWLFTVALIHGIIVQVTKNRWIGTNLMLGGMTFISFVYGTFLTRSGWLDGVSNHSFASMNRAALQVLIGFLATIFIFFMALFFTKGLALAKEASEDNSDGIDRENMYRFGTLFLSLLATGIALGMSWPWFTALQGGKGSAIEEPQYHLVVVWFFIPILLLMGLAPFVTWRKMTGKDLWNRVISVFSVSAGTTGFMLVAMQNPTIGVHMIPGSTVRMPGGFRMLLMPWMAILCFVSVFCVVANLWRIAEIVKRSKLTLGGFIAHIGVAVLMSGLIISRGFEQKERSNLDPALGSVHILGYTFTLDKIDRKNMLDRDGKVVFNVTAPGGEKFKADLGLYYFYNGDDPEPKPMVWPFIQKHLSHDFYMAMEGPDMFAWPKPVAFKPGETKKFAIGDPDAPIDTMSVTYQNFTRNGEPGMAGTTFGAVLHVVDDFGSFDITPTIKVGGEPDMPKIGPLFSMAFVGMDAADKSVNLQLLFNPPLYPITVFYKPMTILVWLGTAIFVLGGLMSAFARRNRPKAAEIATEL